MTNETLRFAMYLTGHGEDDIKQMYEGWAKGSASTGVPMSDQQKKYSEEDMKAAFKAGKERGVHETRQDYKNGYDYLINDSIYLDLEKWLIRYNNLTK
jgi:hypothetical protein